MRAIMALVLFGAMPFLVNAQELFEGDKRQWRLRGQFAGYQGLFSVGGGPVLAKGLWRPALMYGFAPADPYRSAVHQIIVRNDFVFMRGEQRARLHISPTASLNLLMETGTHSFLSLPDRFPRGYYMAP